MTHNVQSQPMSLVRPRRLRRQRLLRNMVAETFLPTDCLMQPYFVVAGHARHEPIEAMPGVARMSVDILVPQTERAMASGLNKVLLFGVLDDGDKDDTAKKAADSRGPVASAVRALKNAFGDALVVATDVCLCGTLHHGHCGVLSGDVIDNDASFAPLSNMALCHADAGADIVSPSDMMDGRVLAIRQALERAQHTDTVIMSYAVKYASSYYGPFRHAAHSAPNKGDRKSYQMDVRNKREALREVVLDQSEGADIIMVKPALAYLDVIATVRARSLLPLACYSVSGEYAMVKAAAAAGFVDEAQIVRENMMAMRRAGADIIISYHATDALAGHWLRT